MKVEVLASVMNASLPETVQHMNLQSDAVIINQCDRLGQEDHQSILRLAVHGLGINIVTRFVVLHQPALSWNIRKFATALSYTRGSCSSVPSGKSISGLMM